MISNLFISQYSSNPLGCSYRRQIIEDGSFNSNVSPNFWKLFLKREKSFIVKMSILISIVSNICVYSNVVDYSQIRYMSLKMIDHIPTSLQIHQVNQKSFEFYLFKVFFNLVKTLCTLKSTGLFSHKIYHLSGSINFWRFLIFLRGPTMHQSLDLMQKENWVLPLLPLPGSSLSPSVFLQPKPLAKVEFFPTIFVLITRRCGNTVFAVATEGKG